MNDAPRDDSLAMTPDRSPKRRRRGWLIAFAFSGLAMVIAFVWSTREPRIDGKSLGYWLSAAHGHDQAFKLQAEEAIRRLGPKAFPYLESRLHSRQQTMKLQWHLLERRLLKRKSPPPDDVPGQEALFGYKALGALSIEPLLEMFKREDRKTKVNALRALGQPAIAAEASAIESTLI